MARCDTTSSKLQNGILFKAAALLFAILFIYLAAPANQAISKGASVPSDFEVTLTSAGLGPHRGERNSVVISVNGKCRFESGSNVAGTPWPVKSESFRISRAAVARIHEEINTQRFAELEHEYRDPDIHDGDLAEITVQSHHSRKQVRSINSSVDNFDAIARSINRELPKQFRIFYNAIYEF